MRRPIINKLGLSSALVAGSIFSTNNYAACTSTITNTATISTTITDTADGQCLVNEGTINVTGSNADGIATYYKNAVLINNGTINATGPSANDGLVSNGSNGNTGGSSFLNSGTITGSGSSSAIYGIWLYNDTGPIDSVVNSGTIQLSNDGQTVGIFNYSGNTITTLTNSGNITVSGSYGAIANNSAITTLNNSGSIVSNGNAHGIVNNSGASIGTLNNIGSISIATAFYGIVNNSGASIGVLNNSGTISVAGAGNGIYNIGTIGTLNNSGTIFASGAGGVGIYNVGTITTLTNYGSIGGGGEGILNAGIGLITLNNAQGGNGSSPATTALTYSGSKPTNYNIIINSSTHYGQIVFLTAGGSIERFGIYGSPFITSRTYASVLAGTGGVHVGNSSGTYDNMTWSLVENGADIYDLIFTGASLMGTQQSLVNTASVLQGTFTLQNSVMVNGFTYDCSLFDKHGICISAGGRNTTVQAQGINNTSGLLIASYRLNKNNTRIGAWVDQNLSVSGPGTVQLGNSTPMIGLFGVWSQRPDGVGAEVKVSAAYGQKDTTITRQVVGTSEAGSGGSQLISQGAQVVAKYGFAVLPDVVVSPYAGVRYTQNNMGGYTEAATSAVTAPLTYSALNTNATTALAGAEARYRGIPKTTLFASAGVETDTNTSNGSYSATGVTGLTPVNFNPNPVKTRPTATVGGYYDILKNQRIGITGIYRQEPFQAVSTTTVLATYTIGL